MIDLSDYQIMRYCYCFVLKKKSILCLYKLLLISIPLLNFDDVGLGHAIFIFYIYYVTKYKHYNLLRNQMIKLLWNESKIVLVNTYSCSCLQSIMIQQVNYTFAEESCIATVEPKCSILF